MYTYKSIVYIVLVELVPKEYDLPPFRNGGTAISVRKQAVKKTSGPCEVSETGLPPVQQSSG